MTIIKERSFYKHIFRIALPIALQNLITFLTNMMDSVMLGSADEEGVLFAAAALANQPFFILSMICFGLSGGAIVLCAQYWGKRDTESIKDIFAMVLKVSAVLSFIIGAAVLLFPEFIMSLYSNDPALVAAATDYLGIIGYIYFFFGVGNTLLCMLRSVEAVKVAVVVNLSSLFVNVFLNWVLIFGKLGMPAMGIRGAALATLIARAVEFIIIMVYFLATDKRLKFRVRDFRRFNKTLAKDLLRHGSPVFFNELLWSLGITLQSVILGHIRYSAGDPVGANSIAGTVQQLSTIVIFGLANAAAVSIGTALGEGKREETKARADTLVVISVIVGALACGLIFLLRDPFISLYDIPDATKALARELLAVMAVITFFVSMSAFNVVGVLRGGGDTFFCLSLEMGTLWLLALPAAFLGAIVFEIPVPLVLLCMKIDEPTKAITCWFRTRGTKWMKGLTRDRADITADT